MAVNDTVRVTRKAVLFGDKQPELLAKPGDLGIIVKTGSSGSFVQIGRTGETVYLFRGEYEVCET